jgi:hypothetical protein
LGWRAKSFMVFWAVFGLFLRDSASSQVALLDAESDDWSQALASDTAEAYFGYLLLHPRGQYFEDAIDRLRLLGALGATEDIIASSRTSALQPVVPKKKKKPVSSATRSAPVPDVSVPKGKKASLY